MTSPTFYYVHDPMCSWCWGHRPEWDKLEASLPDTVTLKKVVGGLAPDSDVPMPAEQAQTIAGYWKRIEGLLGTKFNHDFWTENTPRRSTYPACRAVIAARWQDREDDMIHAIQEAYYLRALNPSDLETHVKLAGELGMDVSRFEADLTSDKLENTFQEELSFARSLPIQGFPSMVLVHEGRAQPLPLDYQDSRPVLDLVRKMAG